MPSGLRSGLSLVKVRGVKGAQGIQGPQGVKGDTGAQGAQGIQGVKGDTGAQGAAGSSWNAPILVTSTSTTPRLPGDFLEVDVSSGSISITLPTTSSYIATPKPIKIADIIGDGTGDTSKGFFVNNVTLIANSDQTVHGQSTYLLNRSGISPELYLVSNTWRILGGIVD